MHVYPSVGVGEFINKGLSACERMSARMYVRAYLHACKRAYGWEREGFRGEMDLISCYSSAFGGGGRGFDPMADC